MDDLTRVEPVTVRLQQTISLKAFRLSFPQPVGIYLDPRHPQNDNIW